MFNPPVLHDPIESVEARTVVVPLEKPLAFSTRDLAQRNYTITRVRTRAGIEGRGFCYCGNRAGHLVTRFVGELLRDHVIGKDPSCVNEIFNCMYGDAILLGRRGAALRAISTIDLAIWDVMAQARQLPLHKLLGESRAETVPCYASGGYYWEDVDPVEIVAEEVSSYVDAGFEAVKIKIGRLSLEEEVRRVRTAREILGPDKLLMLDANNSWKDAATAIHDINALTAFDPFWVEEPLIPDDMRGHAEIRKAVRVPIATGEIEATRWGFSDLMELEAAQILQPDAAVLGGITEFCRVSDMAAVNHIPLYPHWFHQLHVSLAIALPSVVMVEYFTDFRVFNFGELLEETAPPVKGQLPVPQQAGIGLRFDDEAVNRYAVDDWA
jgi:L-alanine-DL-glutamate epimerase-like enolase superfamily enzyme